MILKLDIFCDSFGYGYNRWFDFIYKKWRRACFRLDFLNISFNDNDNNNDNSNCCCCCCC